ncbi:HlyD family efflux transporter periplasmic adaptor subunit [Brevibacillus sp. SYP-B805]|uniref:HlyD family efflux transporter periplasmic adaptor subunit n=1 Tax=Brevibacillus sp. SYP-B805 TaxID=1578199 RepID=UPI0013EA83B9|nr:HlyD family efflux transporter periplasmic adaptor subunit [Brevibacillus sp. SYP-B805]NGQ94789.1 HlyD family efflux transporter periplasmic adaptor subunit [Brevibacillus sp. SYP-B805]
MKAKPLLTALIGFYLLGTAGISGYFWYHHQNYVETDDARTKVNVSLVTAPATGQLVSLPLRENQEVQAGEVLGWIEAPAATSAMDGRYVLKAPVSGRVMRIGVHQGEVVTSGQNLLAIADPDTAYVEALLTETEASRVRVGQTADVSLDTAGGATYTGIVSGVEGVTVSAVWPLISLTAPRQQPREEQLVPVRIKVMGARLIPGTSASVKIRVRGETDGLF